MVVKLTADRSHLPRENVTLHVPDSKQLFVNHTILSISPGACHY